MTRNYLAVFLLFLLSNACECPGFIEPEPDAGSYEEVDAVIPVEVDASGGVNLVDDPAKLRDNELTYSKNLIPGGSGMLVKRPPLDFVAFAGFGSSYVPLALQGPVSPTSGFFVVVAWSRTTNDVILGLPDGAGSSINHSILSSVTTVPNATIFNFGESQYVFGNAPGATYRKKLTGTSLADFLFAGTGNSNLYPIVLARYRSRAVLANFGAGFERHIVFTDNFDITKIGDSALTSRSIIVGDDGDKIIAIREIATTGDKLRPSLLVLLRYSAFVITGQPNQTTDSSSLFGDMEITRLPYNSGCASANTVVTTPYGTIWAGPDNVWMFRVGQGVIPVGSKIRPVLQNTPDTMLHRWNAAFFDGFYRLAVFSEGQGPDEVSQLGEQWWLDMTTDEQAPSNDASAKWYGPQIFNLITDDIYEASPDLGVPDNIVGTLMFTQDTRPGASPNLYGFDRGWAAGGVIFISSYGTQSGTRDISYDSSLTEDAVTGTEILMDLRTKRYGLAPKEAPLAKVFRKGEATVYTTTDGRLTYQCDNDRGSQLDTITEDINKYGMATGDPLDGGVLAEKVQAVAFWPEPTTRRSAQSLQFRLFDTAGYIINENNDEFVFSDAAIAQAFRAIIPHGLYTVTELLTALTDAMTDAAGSSYSYTRAVSGLVRITNPVANTLTFHFATNPGGFTAAQLAKTRRVGTILGYNVSADASGSPNVDASTSVYEREVPAWEIHGMSALVHMTGKRPQ